MDRKKIIIPIIIITAVIIILIIVINKSSRYNDISIDNNKWNELISVRYENKKLTLEDIEFNEYNGIIDENNNTVYYSVVNDSPNKYNPNISYKASEESKIAILKDDITDEKVRNNYTFKLIIYNANSYHIYNLKCTAFPVLNIEYKNVSDGKKTIPMQMYLFDNLSNAPSKVTISDGKIRIGENQNNYKIILNMISPGKNIRENKRPLLNMKPSSEYILTPANDVTQHKNLVELFINNEYKGKYTIE
ncbi:MAG: hypothetical protein IKF97_06120 [Clostridia bacterium]|nr:hypothetical protein [Clostridia bacterium]